MTDLIDLAERGILPDWLIRRGIRRLLAARIKAEAKREATQPGEPARRFIAELRSGPIAIATDAANVQHYEVPSETLSWRTTGVYQGSITLEHWRNGCRNATRNEAIFYRSFRPTWEKFDLQALSCCGFDT